VDAPAQCDLCPNQGKDETDSYDLGPRFGFVPDVRLLAGFRFRAPLADVAR
jgi:hypothetical protein